MLLTFPLIIQKSVGAGGKNLESDVFAVQARLNEFMPPEAKALVVDGKIGRKTIAMIKSFQLYGMKFARPDGRIDPGKLTENGLNSHAAASTWQHNYNPFREPEPKAKAKVAESAAPSMPVAHQPEIVPITAKPYKDKEGHTVIASGKEAMRVAHTLLADWNDIDYELASGNRVRVPKCTVDLKLKTVFLGIAGSNSNGQAWWIKGNKLYQTRPSRAYIRGVDLGGLATEINRRTRAIKPAANTMAAFCLAFGTGILGTAGLGVSVALTITKGLVFVEGKGKELALAQMALPKVYDGLKYIERNCPNFYRYLISGMGNALLMAIKASPGGITPQNAATVLGKIMGAMGNKGGIGDVTIKTAAAVISKSILTTLPLIAGAGLAKDAKEIAASVQETFRSVGITVSSSDAEKIAEELRKPGVPDRLVEMETSFTQLETVLFDLANHFRKAGGHDAVQRIQKPDPTFWDKLF